MTRQGDPKCGQRWTTQRQSTHSRLLRAPWSEELRHSGPPLLLVSATGLKLRPVCTLMPNFDHASLMGVYPMVSICHITLVTAPSIGYYTLWKSVCCVPFAGRDTTKWPAGTTSSGWSHKHWQNQKYPTVYFIRAVPPARHDWSYYWIWKRCTPGTRSSCGMPKT